MNKPSKFNPYKRTHEDEPLSEVLQHIIKGYRLDRKIDALDIIASWKKVMGPGVANYTIDVAYKKEVLYVKLSSAVLREELSYGKSKIIKLINEDIGKESIKEIVFR